MKKLDHDQRVFLLSLWAGFPAVVVALLLLFLRVEDTKVVWTVGAIVVLV